MKQHTPRVVVALAIVLAVSVPGGPAFAQPHRSGLDPAPRELKLGDSPVSIPMQRYHGWAVVEALVNGKGPYLFVIDTGAPGLLVDNRFKDEMAFGPYPGFGDSSVAIRVAGPNGKGLPATIHFADTLELGSARLLGLPVIATKLPFRNTIAGVIGMGVFKECLLTLDYPNSNVILARGDLPPTNARDVVDFTQPRQRGSHPVIPIELCGKEYDFTLDTGSSGWLAFPKDVSEHCPLSYGPVAGPRGRTVDAEIETSMVRLKTQVAIGGIVVENPHGRVLQNEEWSPLIGSRILQEFALTLDQKNMRIRFGRETRTPIVPPPFRTAGFALMQQDKGFVVWGLMPDSAAERAGLGNGDVVVALNGKPPGDIYARPVWDKILEGKTVNVRYIPADQPDPLDIDVDIFTLVP